MMHALIALDKLDKIGREGVAKELTERGIGDQPGERLLDFFVALNSLDHAAEVAAGDDPAERQVALNAAILGRLVEFVGDNEAGAKGYRRVAFDPRKLLGPVVRSAYQNRSEPCARIVLLYRRNS